MMLKCIWRLHLHYNQYNTSTYLHSTVLTHHTSVTTVQNYSASSSRLGSSFNIEFKELYWSIVILISITVLTTEPNLNVVSGWGG